MFLKPWREKGECHENFLSTTGEGSSDPHYTWGALMVLIAVEEYVDANPWHGLKFGTLEPVEEGSIGRYPVQNSLYDIAIGNSGMEVKRDGKQLFAASAAGGDPACADTGRGGAGGASVEDGGDGYGGERQVTSVCRRVDEDIGPPVELIRRCMHRISRRGLMIAAGGGSLAAAASGAFARETSGSNDLVLDGDRLPFSRFGSYWAVSKRWELGATQEIPAGEWYIRLLADDVNPNELFRMEMLKGGTKVAVTPRLTAAELMLSGGTGAAVQFVVAAPDVLRVRGRGCSLRLNAIKGSYGYAVQRSAASWEVMTSVNMPRVEVRTLQGSLAVEAPWSDELHAASCASVTVNFSPDESGAFEGMLHYYDAVPRAHVDSGRFESLVATVQQEFGHWVDQLPQLRTELQDARLVAAYVLWSSTVNPRGLYREPVVWCSKSWMNRIWSWDHCYVAVGLAPSTHELAWQQLMLFRDMQDPASGMLADSFTNVRRSWLCTKPPVHGWALSHMRASMPISNAQLAELYEPLRKWTNFWLRERNLGGDGLPCILNPNESFDNTTANTLFGPVKAPEIAAYLVLQMEALAATAEKLGHESDEQEWSSEVEADGRGFGPRALGWRAAKVCGAACFRWEERRRGLRFQLCSAGAGAAASSCNQQSDDCRAWRNRGGF